MNEAAASASIAQAEQARTLEIVRRFPVAPEKVFTAWTDPNELVHWFGPVEVKLPECEVDLRVGGAWHAVMENADGGRYYVSGEYVEIVFPSRLAFTWAWTTDGVKGHETIVTIDFVEDDGETEMRFHQALFAEPEHRDNHEGGWTSAFEGLAAHLSGNSVK